MRQKILFIAAAFLAAVLLAFRNIQKQKLSKKILAYSASRERVIIRCSPNWDELNDWLEESDIPPMPGAGSYKWKISTHNDSAQFYFNQGVNMYYGFHIIESMASFKKATRFDPACAMLYWAQALAYGPNINDFGYIASPDALGALGKAKEFAGSASNFEKALIDAMSVRYTADSANVTRKKLNQDYTEMMRKMYEKFPGEADAAALYADAMMLEHPWDLWNVNGTPKAWTPHIREVLEKILLQSPLHPGANHYYIHVMEPSPYAAKALTSAGRLGKTNPGLSHLVHMPSHIYLRTGRYQSGIDVNISAVSSYKKSRALYAPVSGADFLYLIHNLHMKTNNAMLAGQYKTSIETANETITNIPADYLNIPAPMGNYVQYIYSTPALVYVRFGKWEELLKLTQPEKAYIFSNIMYHWGRGFAFAKEQKFDKAGEELDKLRELMKDSSLNIPFVPFSPAIESARVAEQLLLGVIHEERNLFDGAIRHYSLADSIESAMVYNEPRDWMLNPRQFLGNAYLKAGKWREAAIVLNKDLQNNSENGWALYGLWQALSNQGKTSEALKIFARAKKAFARADIKIKAAVF